MRIPPLFVAGAALALTAWATGTSAGAPRSEDGAEASPVYPVDATVEGKTYKEWNIAMVRWAYSIPKDRNPITDRTGAHAGEGQSGPVWFLGGNFGGVTRRRVTVPAGKPIFSPLLYALVSTPPDKAEAKRLTAGVKERNDQPVDLDVTLDGKSLGDLSSHRVASGAFDFTGPEEDQALHSVFAGKRVVATDGYWLMLKPLPTGDHTLRIKAKRRPGEGDKVEDRFWLDITYGLHVEDRGKP